MVEEEVGMGGVCGREAQNKNYGGNTYVVIEGLWVFPLGGVFLFFNFFIFIGWTSNEKRKNEYTNLLLFIKTLINDCDCGTSDTSRTRGYLPAASCVLYYCHATP